MNNEVVSSIPNSHHHHLLQQQQQQQHSHPPSQQQRQQQQQQHRQQQNHQPLSSHSNKAIVYTLMCLALTIGLLVVLEQSTLRHLRQPFHVKTKTLNDPHHHHHQRHWQQAAAFDGVVVFSNNQRNDTAEHQHLQPMTLNHHHWKQTENHRVDGRHDEESNKSDNTTTTTTTTSQPTNVDSISKTPSLSSSLLHYDDNNGTAVMSITPTTNASHQQRISIIVLRNGELGNHLSRIAQAVGLSLWAREYHHGCCMEMEWILRNNGRTRRAESATKKCFTNLAHVDFHRGNTPEYDQRLFEQQQQQQVWWNMSSSSSGNGSDGNHNDDDLNSRLTLKSSRVDVIEKSFQTLKDFLTWTTNQTNIISTTTTTTSESSSSSSSHDISMPFLTAAGDVAMVDVLADKYYDEFRKLFTFDDNACCKLKPDPDESVLHFRNYKREMGKHAAANGFDELDPNRTAHELFRNLQAGDKVAITSRYGADPSVQPYVDALTNRGIRVRVITGQSGVQDFCFLMHAQKELVGVAESTYALWAGYLGNATKVRLYSMDTKGRRQSPFFSHRVFIHYNWTNPKLQQKVSFELYKELDEEDDVNTPSSDTTFE